MTFRRLMTFTLVVFCALATWLPARAGGPAPEQFSLAIQQRLSATLDQQMHKLYAPGVVVDVSVPGRGSWVVARGVADLATGQPETLDDHVRIGSVTKTFTVTAILMLAGEGKLSINDPISKYIPSVPNGDHITLLEMASMTSGLFNYTEDDAFVHTLISHPYRYWPPSKLVAVAFRHPPYFPPGQGLHYSNTNTVLLGMVVQKVTGARFGTFLQDRILQPLGMTQTSMPNTGALPVPYAHGYTEQTLNGKLGDATHWNPSWGWTAGAMVSTLADLHTWSIALGRGTLLTPHMRQVRQASIVLELGQSAKYGIGLVTHGGWVWHNGTLPGYQTFVGYLPALHASLVVNVNSDIPYQGLGPADTIAHYLAAVVTPSHQPVALKH